MADSVPEVAHLAIHLADGCAKILKPLLRFLGRPSPRNPAVDLAVVVLLLVLPMAYVAAVVLAYFAAVILRSLNLAAPASATALYLAYLGLFVVLLSMLVSAWLLLSALPLAAFFSFLGKPGISPVFSWNMLS